MNKLMMFAFVGVALFATSGVLAAPPARTSASKSCAHCPAGVSKPHTPVASRAALFGIDTKPCPGLAARMTVARWGNAIQPCPDCAKG